MRLDAVVPSYIDRSCLKVSFHNAEAVFNDPSTAIQFDDDGGRILKNRTQGVKTVEAGFLVYHFLIEGKIFNLSKFPVRGAMLGLDEALGVIRALAFGCRSLTLFQQSHCTCYLPVTDTCKIIPVLNGEGYDDALLQCLTR